MRRPSNQTATALQTCDARSASAHFPVGADLGRRPRRLFWTGGPAAISSRSQEAGESNPAGRLWRPARSQIASYGYWVSARYRSGTFAFTARRAGPLHHGHHVGQGGWICPSGLRFPKPALIYPSSTLNVLPSGIEPAPPGLQPGAITRSATGASRWPDWRPASRILGYEVVKDRANEFGDEESNLDGQGQSLPACH